MLLSNIKLIHNLLVSIKVESVCLLSWGHHQVIDTNMCRQVTAIEYGFGNISTGERGNAVISSRSGGCISFVPYQGEFGFNRPGMDTGNFYIVF